ncbi:hypothetical protein A8F94_04500 [Bacillus sp. FJAT-27225]|uniref:LysM peptidoglycan-binding domain-containing protein n=1 Tax=Bacillus sp. FJAT-27225 TaxID=1743144 RepID=UPI00080C239D|nr:LysM domain-containing protein [Bacillus sp. FJAT-27225]OCA91125.1 hypothetical protein A8F94_04500 [Bacillus sp. FJAT-27225]
MKKLIATLFTIALIASVYVDLTSGTLPAATAPIGKHPEQKKETSSPATPHFKATVKPGQTLLSIVEEYGAGNPGVPISKLITDFETLNPGSTPESLQAGKTYLFPSYSN